MCLQSDKKENDALGLILIGAYDFLKGCLFFVISLGALHFVHRDIEKIALQTITYVHVDPNNHYIHKLIAASGLVTPKQLRIVAAGSLFYAIVHSAQGIGLMFRKRWAELLTVVTTGLFIPLEVFELVKVPSVTKGAILGFNIVCLAYVGRAFLRKPS